MDVDILMTALKVAQDEQLKATTTIVQADRKEPLVAPFKFPTKKEYCEGLINDWFTFYVSGRWTNPPRARVVVSL
jgi:hypothetical protein